MFDLLCVERYGNMGRMLVYVLAFIIIFFVYLKLPRAIRVVAFGLNCIIPDPVPYLDETVMLLGMIPR